MWYGLSEHTPDLLVDRQGTRYSITMVHGGKVPRNVHCLAQGVWLLR